MVGLDPIGRCLNFTRCPAMRGAAVAMPTILDCLTLIRKDRGSSVAQNMEVQARFYPCKDPWPLIVL